MATLAAYEHFGRSYKPGGKLEAENPNQRLFD
jgi:hypothetical protein